MLRQAVALAIHPPDRPDRVLLVRRPPDDHDLPDLWGLPAASLRSGESDEDAARRAGRDKLGVELSVEGVLRAGETERAGYRLSMRVLEATIVQGTPHVPQPVAGVTQYTEWRWGTAPELRPAADRGSLCCRLFLEHTDD